MTEVTKLEFTFKYMNAGGVWRDYEGQMKRCTHCDTYNDYNAEHCVNECGYWSHENCNHNDDPELNQCNPVWKYYPLESELDTQNLAIVLRAVKWYTYQKITWDGGEFGKTSITVEKTTVDGSGNKVEVDDTFYFDIYVDYHNNEGEKLFETLAVSTKDGSGKKTSTTIYWEGRNVIRQRNDNRGS